MYDAAITNSPHNNCDIVIASAVPLGTTYDLWMVRYQFYAMPPGVMTRLCPILTPINEPAVKLELNVVNMNLIGTFYTWKLAIHYFRKQTGTEDGDRCIASWIDSSVSFISGKYIRIIEGYYLLAQGKLAIEQ
ncbi:hypothetical protein N7536_009386 [Penicillium majusculum]|nr:hypothetical protein N7536_009386 [Penicillium majusculum]